MVEGLRRGWCYTQMTLQSHSKTYQISKGSACWSSVFIRRIIYKFLNVCPFDYTAFAVSGKVGIP